jgi:PAS domain S-box-containing protein
MAQDHDSALGEVAKTAEQLCHMLKAAACSIYVREGEGQFVLFDTYTSVADGPHGLALKFSAEPLGHLMPDGTWKGLTSFVAWSRRELLLESVDVPKSYDIDGQRINLHRDGSSCEIQAAGSFIAAPIVEVKAVRGVVRLVRRSTDRAFEQSDLAVLLSCRPWVAVALAQARARTHLIEGLFDIAATEKLDTMLEKLASAVLDLVGGDEDHCGIFLWDPEKGHYRFHTATKAADAASRGEYAVPSRGLTGYIMKHCRPLLSTDLPYDLERRTDPRSPLYGVTPSTRPDATDPPQMRSFVGVPIGQRPEGVIRVSSRALNAFTYRDKETLEGLARQTQVLLAHRRHVRSEERKFLALIRASPQPVIAVDNAGIITEFNEAAQNTVGYSRADALRGKSVVDVVYGGNRALAGATNRAIHNSSSRTCRDHYTLFYRQCDRGNRQIPIPVRLAASLLSDDSKEIIGSIGFFENMRSGQANNYVTEIEADISNGTSAHSKERAVWLTVDPVVAKTFERVRDLGREARLGPVLVVGPTGSGKEAIARALHHYAQDGSPRPFEALNCAGLNEQTLEVELFGAEPHTYTGGPLKERKPGVFERAKGGTVFLDEISTLTPVTQAKLLRCLGRYGDVEVRPVGGQALNVMVQVVAAANEDLAECVKSGRFREDLYQRLNAVELVLPALVDRGADILLLAEHFRMLELGSMRTGGDHGKEPPRRARGFASDAVRVLLTHPWPGNIRELENVVRYATRRCVDEGSNASGFGYLIEAELHFPKRIVKQADGAPVRLAAIRTLSDEEAISIRLELVEREVDMLRRQLRISTPPIATWLAQRLAADATLREDLLNDKKGIRTRILEIARREGVTGSRATGFDAINKWLNRQMAP